MAKQQQTVAQEATIDLNRVAALVAVVEAHSFTAAAKARGVPKSSLSRAVSRLEQELGVLLLQRTTRKLALTEAGRNYVARAREALGMLTEAREAIVEADDEPRGTVRLSSVPDPYGQLLAGPLTRFLQKHPRIHVELALTQRMVDLVEEGFDLAVRGGKLVDSSLIARRVGGTPQRMVAAPSYLERRGTPKRLQDVAQHDCILFRAARGTQRWTLTGKTSRPEHVDVRGPVSVDDFPFVVQMCLAGAGIGLAPRMLSEELVLAGKLVPVLPSYQVPGGSVYLVHPATRHLPRRVALLRDHLAQELSAQFTQCERLLGS